MPAYPSSLGCCEDSEKAPMDESLLSHFKEAFLLTSPEHLPRARQRSKFLTCVNSFDSHVYEADTTSLFTEEETEAGSGLVTLG